MTKLTIVTPSYNQGGFIGETLESILSQEIDFELEYIIMDGQSTDQTDEIIKSYIPLFEKKNVDIRYISKNDKGQADAINKGFRLAKGEILTYINSDDYYEKDALKKVIRFFNDNKKFKWAYGGWNYVNRKGNLYMTKQPEYFSKNKLLNFCNIGQPSCFFKKDLLEEVGYLNENLHLSLDYDLWLKFARKQPAGIMPFVISNMRYYEEAKSGSKTFKHLMESYKVRTKHTNPFSWRRTCQLFHLARGSALVFLKKDITRRVVSKK